MNAHTLTVESEVKGADINAIVAGLMEYNARHAAGDRPKNLVVSLRDGQGDLIGGLVGATYLGWLQVQVLWLPDELRGHGYGKALLSLAEKEAVQRGCPRVFLETLGFQALGFYERLGYQIVGEYPDFPPGGVRYALTKILVSPAISVGTQEYPLPSLTPEALPRKNP